MSNQEYARWPQQAGAQPTTSSSRIAGEADCSTPCAGATPSPELGEINAFPAPAPSAAQYVPRLMTLDEVAEFLAVTPRWVYDNHEPLGMPALRIGRTLRFRPTQIESWLETRATRPEPRPLSTTPAHSAEH